MTTRATPNCIGAQTGQRISGRLVDPDFAIAGGRSSGSPISPPLELHDPFLDTAEISNERRRLQKYCILGD
jgi:hypothetical protein